MKINSIVVEDLDPIKTIALQHIGEYSGIAAAFGRLGEWAGRKGYFAKQPRMAGVYHDDPCCVPAEKLRSSACLEDMGGMEPEAGMQRYEISGGKYLSMNAEVTMSEYGDGWMEAQKAVCERGLTIDASRAPYELYISCVDGTQGDDAPWIVEFRIPVK